MANARNRDEGKDALTEIVVSQRYLEKNLDTLQKLNAEQTKTLLAALQTHADDDTRRFGEHDKRLKFLENWRTWAIGGLAMLAALLALIGMFLKAYI